MHAFHIFSNSKAHWPGEEPQEDIALFDSLMVMLYDWGDQKVGPSMDWPGTKLCWVRTF